MSSLLDPRLADCRRLFLRGHEVWINIGAHDYEKRAEQRVRVDVSVFVPLASTTPRHDRLDEVVDYDMLRQTIARRAARGHIHLLETLADDIARELLAHPQVRAVRISTEKPDVYPDCEGVGIEVFAFKAEPR